MTNTFNPIDNTNTHYILHNNNPQFPLHAHPLWPLSPFFLHSHPLLHPFLQEQPFIFLPDLLYLGQCQHTFEKEIRGVDLSSMKQSAKTLSRITCRLLEIGKVTTFRAITLYLHMGTINHYWSRHV
jgi:hypothetical protein